MAWRDWYLGVSGVAGAAALFAAGAPVLAQAAGAEGGEIVVTGTRQQQAAAAASQAKAITPKPSGDVPLARHYAPICVKTFGIDPAYGDVIAQRVKDNTKLLGLPVGGAGCAANVWIGFISDSKNEVAHLRKAEPEMFADLKPFEIDRIFRGSGAAQVWHATEQRNVDGRPMNYTNVGGRAVKSNSTYQTGRLVSPIRTDINGSIVIFDSVKASGLTVQQLADYATMRVLAPVEDVAKVEPTTVSTILTLFAANADPRPDSLTEFDWAFLSGFYRLDRGARASAVHDATQKSMLDGTATGLVERADAASRPKP